MHTSWQTAECPEEGPTGRLQRLEGSRAQRGQTTRGQLDLQKGTHKCRSLADTQVVTAVVLLWTGKDADPGDPYTGPDLRP